MQRATLFSVLNLTILLSSGCPTPGLGDGEGGGDTDTTTIDADATDGTGNGDGDPGDGDGDNPDNGGLFIWPVCYEDGPMITEGWFYSLAEQAWHGEVDHHALDIAPDDYGDPVFAPRAGWALATYQVYPINSSRGVIGYGGGLVVEILHDDGSRSGLYHLSAYNSALPYYAPEASTSADGYPAWYPWVLVQADSAFLEYATYRVEQGEWIGNVGVTGLAAPGIDETPSMNPSQLPSWDEPHVHWELFLRGPTGSKMQWWDPTGINGTVDNDDYLTVFEVCPTTQENPNWLIACHDGIPIFPPPCGPNP